jgi:Cytochrome C'
MRIHAVKWTLCGVLVLGMCLLAGKSSFSADDDDAEKKAKAKAIAEARAAVLDLAGGKGDAMAVAAKHAIGDVMHGFKTRSKDGIGFGAAAGGNPKLDGIEAKINSIAGPMKMTAAQIKMQEADLIKMLDIVKTIGEINKNYTEDAKKDPGAWKKYTEDMIQDSKTAQEAVKKGDPVEVKKTITKLSASCADCHSKFRD